MSGYIGYIIIVSIFCILLAIQNIIHYRERRDLYNRIMCKDYSEYSSAQKVPGKSGNFIKNNLDKKARG